MSSVGQITDYAEARGVDFTDEPPENGFVVIFSLPDDVPWMDQPHDAVVYDDDHSPTSYGFFERAEAAEFAVEKAKESNIPLLSKIYEYDDSYWDASLDDIDW